MRLESRGLLLKLGEKGITVKHDSGKLKFFGDLSTLTATDKNEIVSAKQEIIAFLTSKSSVQNAITRLGKKRSPLSFAQQRIWFIDNLQGGSVEYNLPAVFEIAGKLNLEIVNHVFTTILERHESIRTVYVQDGNDVVQKIRPIEEVDFAINERDLRHLSGQTLAGEVQHRVVTDVTKPFNLAEDLMLRVNYLKTSTDSGVLIFNMHHIASDGWSMEVLTKEFFALYHAYSEGRHNPLSELEIQYADYAYWQRENLTDEVLATQVAYWQEQLAELPTVHSLPLDYARPAIRQHHGAVVTGTLPVDVAAQLLMVAKAYKLTPFMLLHGALSLLLSRHSNSSDIVIGTPVANRLQSELEPLIGFFVNTLVLRVDTAHETLSDYFAHVRQVHLAAQSHQDVPFEQLVERLKIPRSTSHSPLFQIMLTTNTYFGLNAETDKELFTLPDLDVKPYEFAQLTAKFDLNVDLSFHEQGLSLYWNYDTSLFTEQHIQQLDRHLCRLLEGLVESQGQLSRPISALPMLSAEEIRQLHSTLNGMPMPYAKEKCIHNLFEQQVDDHPDKVAVVYENTQLTYRELNERANQLAHYLKHQHGVSPDCLVGLCVERSLEMVIGLLGILKAGGAYVPLDPAHPPERLHYMLDDAGLDVVLSKAELDSVLSTYSGTVVLLDGVVDNKNVLFSQYSDRDLAMAETGLNSSHLAYVIYTSGSTGQPKGVMLEHKSVVNYLSSIEKYEIDNISRSVISTSLNFDATVTSLFAAWLKGGELHLLPEKEELFISLHHYIKSEVPTLFKLTPSHLQALELQEPVTSHHRLVVGGEAFSLPLARKITTSLPNSRFVNEYGPTEATVGCSFEIFDSGTLASSCYVNDVAIGIPIANIQFHILDKALKEVPYGVSGELFISGDCLARGYLNQPQLTADRFIANLGLPDCARRIYRTGDRVRLHNNKLVFEGRMDEQVKIRGFRVELGEITALIEQNRWVDSCVVRAVNGHQEDPVLVAYVKPVKGNTFNVAEQGRDCIRQGLAKMLPYYMLPEHVSFLQEWPITTNGKLDFKRLPSVDFTAAKSPAYKAPRSDNEILLAQIWSELLSMPIEKVSVEANFFELGGHSLLTAKMQSILSQRYDFNLPLKVIFEKPTIEHLGSWLDKSFGRAESETTEGDDLGPYIVQLQSGVGEHQTSLFLVHPIGGQIHCYRELVAQLDNSYTIYGLQQSSIFVNSIEELASKYVNALIKCQNEKDCINLVGWSFGGIVCFEMAQQLSKLGYRISLTLIDSQFPQPSHGQLSNISLALTLAGEFNIRFENMTELERSKIVEFDEVKLSEKLWELGREQGKFPVELSKESLEKLFLQIKHNAKTGASYQPKLYTGRCNYIQASESASKQFQLAWRDIAPKMELQKLDGNHFSIFKAPVVTTLSQIVEHFCALSHK
uniref:Peptide synthetase n=1 Tax=Rheinheimera sp. BAL341 TaxID=1708203 RepID=A0A486XMQ5_9GAMM